jgi:ElaB/YqjD/DUF883 family membrane-anchored ribosome-binding protein
MKGMDMADTQGARRGTEAANVPTTTAPESRSAEERREHVREPSRDIRQQAQDLTTQGKEAAAEYYQQGKDVATEYYQQGREQMQIWQQQLEGQVRQKPLQSLLIAAGIGLLIGLLKRR